MAQEYTVWSNDILGDYKRGPTYKDMGTALLAARANSNAYPKCVYFVRTDSNFAIATFKGGKVVG